MAHAGGGAQNHRRAEFLRDAHAQRDEIARFLRVGRLQHGDFGEAGELARILLVLRGMHARVIGDDDDQAGHRADIGERHQRIGGDIQADVFHGDDGARPGQRSSRRHLQRHFLVGRPLAIDFGLMLDQVFQDLGGRRARIPARHRHTGLIRPTRNGFIAGQ